MRVLTAASVTLFTILISATGAAAFSIHPIPLPTVRKSLPVLNGYVPDGFTKEQWDKMKAKEKAVHGSKNYGAVGPRGFKSRSLQSFQEQLEKGQAGHLMPVFNAKEKVKKGKLKQEDIPYMQRGGSWDNSDVKGAKKVAWSKTDKVYKARDEARKNARVDFDWTGSVPRQSPASRANKAAAAAGKTKKDAVAKPKKKMFGLF